MAGCRDGWLSGRTGRPGSLGLRGFLERYTVPGALLARSGARRSGAQRGSCRRAKATGGAAPDPAPGTAQPVQGGIGTLLVSTITANPRTVSTATSNIRPRTA